MFSFFKKTKNEHKNAFAFLVADIHNHILPGIDDGSPDVETSLMLMEGLLELGFKKIVSTPHILADVHPNTRETIEHAYNQLISNQDLSILPPNFTFAAEYMVDYQFEENIKTKSFLSFRKEKYVLIEMSYLVESPNIRQVIFSLLTNGYQPILAHPERYGFYHHNISMYEGLFDAGCELQLNLLSLAGNYGRKVQSVSEKLIEKGFYNWVGTDLHHSGHLTMLQNMATNVKIRRKIEKIKELKNTLL